MTSADEKFASLVNWLETSGFQWSQHLELVNEVPFESNSAQLLEQGNPTLSDAKAGIWVKSRQNLKIGDVVAKIPKEFCLTTQTCHPITQRFCKLIEKHAQERSEKDEESVSSWCMIVASVVMMELSLGEESKFYPYLASLPPSVDLPMFWPDEDRHSLVGTEVQEAMQDAWEMTHREWSQCVSKVLPLLLLEYQQSPPHLPTPDEGNPPDTTIAPPPPRPPAEVLQRMTALGFDEYAAARSLATSRAFVVDGNLKEGLVPLADLFNHLTGGEHVHFMDEQNSQSVVDGPQHATSPKPDASAEPATSAELGSSTSAQSAATTEGLGRVEMEVCRPAQAGVEVFNTYGALGNTHLLNYYAFTQSDNPEDFVGVSCGLIRAVCALAGISGGHIRDRTAWAVEMGLLSTQDAVFKLKGKGVPPEDILVYLGVLHISEEALSSARREIEGMCDGEEYEDLDGHFVIDKRMMRAVECVYRHAHALKQQLEGTKVGNSRKEKSVGEESDSNVGADESLLLTPQVVDALWRTLDRRESQYVEKRSVPELEGELESLVKSNGAHGRRQSVLRVHVGERRIIEAARNHLRESWGWKHLNTGTEDVGTKSENHEIESGNADPNGGWDLFD